MEPITTAIIAAVSAGVVKSASGMGEKVIVDAYEALKVAIKHKLGVDNEVTKAISSLEVKPDSEGRKATLKEEVATNKLDQDAEILEVAHSLLEKIQAQPDGAQHIQNAFGNYIAQADRGKYGKCQCTSSKGLVMAEEQSIRQIAVGSYIAQAIHGTAILIVNPPVEGKPEDVTKAVDRQRQSDVTFSPRGGAWSQIPDLSQTYKGYVEAITTLIRLEEYDHAKDSYWKTLYYSGYRELWKDRLTLSRQLARLSIRRKDYACASAILSKGISYAFTSQNEYAIGESILKQAWKLSSRVRDRQGQAICWNYMADIYAEMGRSAAAVRCYDEAANMSDGLDKQQIILKRYLYVLENDELKSQSRVVALSLLYEQLHDIRDYREGLAEMEIAKSLYALGNTSDALYYSTKAYNFFSNTIIMPRNAIKTFNVLRKIEKG